MINHSLFSMQTSKSIIAAALFSIFVSTATYAHDEHETCDVELEAGLTINQSSIEFFDPDNRQHALYVIDENNQLSIGGNDVVLTAPQQVLVAEYSSRIRAMVPEVRAIAIEGVDLALEGVNLVFNELLGEGNNVGSDLTQELSAIKDEVLTRFTIKHGFTVGDNGLENDELLGNEFEQRIETAIEKAMMGSMGHLLVSLGQEMMFSGGDSDSFETRMEAFGENIEQQMELRAEKIERKANSLCVGAVEIDQLEEALKASISPMSNINVISVQQSLEHQEQNKRLM
ncbi:hypothetical protein NBRC116592_05640 [Colwellia sp. KU-HH00111]|uniref:DUF2884 family protein n=1 Tax=Colwellia sp. KU-HH00111 TaxID=3127652 RepID=UPI0031030578